jgi:hypothetical protein
MLYFNAENSRGMDNGGQQTLFAFQEQFKMENECQRE